jgi:hypothetical protein
MIRNMRRLVVFLTLIALLIVSLAVGWIATDWPHWCRMLNLCDGRGLL